ncbi:MAG: DUF1080 domain-containing protein, partial [Marinilabiliales bacterium]|nr:DUF1080 domain-containing protein [Marinilabiliales bacterium]
MKRIILPALLILPLFLSAKVKEVKLFNGKNLKNWEQYLPANGEKPAEAIFSVVDVKGEKLLRITGEVNASLATRKEYSNYHLRMVFKWGTKVYKQKNSGILYHSYGPFGEGLGVWMSAHEFQLCTGKMGDSYCMGNSSFVINALPENDGKAYRYASTGTKVQFGTGYQAKNCMKIRDNEKPDGEWNVVDLFCFGQTSIHVV